MKNKAVQRRKQFDQVYMEMAKSFSKLSYAIRNKVGCIIVSENDQIISQGFNGTPSGMNNCCEDIVTENGLSYTPSSYNELQKKIKKEPNISLRTRTIVLHAEANAITKCAKNCISTRGGTMYITLSPCIECAKLIVQSEIKRVVYEEEYRNTEGISLLEECGIEVVKIDPSETLS